MTHEADQSTLTIRGSAAAAIVAYATSLGVPVAEIEQRTGLTISQFLDHTAQLPGLSVAKLWDIVAERHHDGVPGIETAKWIPLTAIGPFSHTYRSAANYGAAVRLFIHYRGLVSPELECVLDVSDEHARVEFEHPLDAVDGGHGAVFTLALALRLARESFDVQPRLLAVELQGEATGPANDFAEFFGVDVNFGRHANALVYSPEVLEVPGKAPDPSMFKHLEAFIRELARDAGSPERCAPPNDEGPHARAVSIEFLPRGGRLWLLDQDGEHTVYLAGNRCDLLAALLRPPAPEKPGDWVQDEFLSRQVWPTSVRTRADMNTLIYRVRQDLNGAGVDPAIVERRSGATRLRIAVDAEVSVR